MAFSTVHTASFGPTVAPGSFFLAADIDPSSGTVLASYGPADFPANLDVARAYSITAADGAVQDDLVFNTTFAAGSAVGSYALWGGAAAPPSVPLPAAVWLMLSGLSAVGAMTRRRAA